MPKSPLVEESQPGPTKEYLTEAPVSVPEAVTVNVALPVESKTILQLCVDVATAGHGPAAHAVDELFTVAVSSVRFADGS